MIGKVFTKWNKAAIILICYFGVFESVNAENFVFPSNKFVKNVQTTFNAKGNGSDDDTKALQDAFKDRNGIIYLPNGTYKVSSSIICNGMGAGPWVYGQSRDSVVIKLVDNANGFSDATNPAPVIAATDHKTGDGISADQFFRQWHNFTIDAGNNKGAIGIRYYSNNSGVLDNVKIKGNGKYGLDLGWVDQNGPCLIENLTIEGFDIGIFTDRGLNSQTVVNCSLSNSTSYGIYCKSQVFTIENLIIANTPNAVYCEGMVSIINGSFTGGNSANPAIKNQGSAFLRSITTNGYSKVLSSTGGDVSGASITEYVSEAVDAAFEKSDKHSLNLPIKQQPAIAWEQDTSKWVSVNKYGAVAGDYQDDSKAFQAAIDAAAAAGKTTIYIEASTGGDPNWYTLDSDVSIHGSVRYVLGLGFGRIVAGNEHGFVLQSNAAPVVVIENVNLCGKGGWKGINNSSSTLIIQHCDGFIAEANGTGDVFLKNSCGSLKITNNLAHVWARQWNTEANNDNVPPLINDSDNDGGTLWILGLKTEGLGTKISTRKGGKTELTGAHIYNCNGAQKSYPLFEVTDASATFAMVREINFNGAQANYPFHVKETRNSEVKTWHKDQMQWGLYSASIQGVSNLSLDQGKKRFMADPLSRNIKFVNLQGKIIDSRKSRFLNFVGKRESLPGAQSSKVFLTVP